MVRKEGKTGKRRVGALLSTELLLLLPILLLIVLALVEFTFFITAQTRLAAAGREGARVAALGGSKTDVNTAVATVLGAKLTSHADFKVVVSYPSMSNTTGNPVQVVVSAPANILVPNYLSIIGFDLSKVTLTGQATMIVE